MSSDLDFPPHIHFQGEVIERMIANTHYIGVQERLTERALELLGLDPSMPSVICDVGCGTGIASHIIMESGNVCVGGDIAGNMLMWAARRAAEATGPNGEHIECPNNLCRFDAGHGMPFRAGVFDAAIGIDLLRWLFRTYDGQMSIAKRLRSFLEALQGCLRMGARAVFNFNTKSADQAELLSTIATKCGFGGGLRTDNPNSSGACESWLILEVGGATAGQMKDAFTADGCRNVPAFHSHHKKSKGFNKKEWIVKKKERQRLLGQKTAPDSKYTGRSRRRWN